MAIAMTTSDTESTGAVVSVIELALLPTKTVDQVRDRRDGPEVIRPDLLERNDNPEFRLNRMHQIEDFGGRDDVQLQQRRVHGQAFTISIQPRVGDTFQQKA